MKFDKEMLGKVPIKRLLIKMSVPATVGMMVNALYNLVDTIFVGNGAGPLALGGLAIAFPLQMILMAFSMLLGMGASSVYSRALGAKNYDKSQDVVATCYIAAIVLSIVTTTLGYIFLEPILKLMGATEGLLPYAYEYMSVIILGNLFFSIVMVTNNLVRAEGNAKVSMYTMVIGTGLNIVLDPIFIFIFDMGIRGAAIATIISQFVSFIFIMRYILFGNSTIKIAREHLVFKFNIFTEIVLIGLPSFFRNVAGSVTAMIANHLLGVNGGDIAISVYGTINKLIMFVFMPSFGVVQGLQPIIGFNYGAKKYSRTLDAVNLANRFLLYYFIIGTAIIQLFPSTLLRLFTNDETFVVNGVPALRIMIFAIPIVGIAIVASSYYQAVGKALPAAFLGLSRQVIFLIPLLLILSQFFGLYGVYYSFPVADVLSVAVSYVMIRKELKVLGKLVNENKIGRKRGTV